MMKIGFLGAGGINGEHARRLRHIGEGTLDCVCDVSLASAQAFAGTHGDLAIYSDFEAMLDQRRPDVLYVGLPPFAHSGQVEIAAKRGIHLFLEKPIALTVERGRSMVAAAQASGIVTQVGFFMRFLPAVQQLKSDLISGRAGRPTLFQGTYSCNALHAPWWRHRDKSGGQVFEQVIHVFDTARYLFGPVKRVSGRLANLCHQDVEDYTVEDTSVGTIEFESGALASLLGSNCAIPDLWEYRMNVLCENVTVKDLSDVGADFYDTTTSPVEATRIHHAGVDPYEEESRNFLAAVRGEAATRTPIEDGLTTLELVDAIIRSATANGSWIEMP